MRRSSSNRHRLRWLVLILSAVVTLGSYYCYDNPSALHDQLAAFYASTAYAPHFEIYFNLLYTVYSIPNCALPLLGGLLSDRFGNRLMLVVFSALICAGQLVCLLGIWNQSMLLMLLGRVIFGLGGESLSVAGSALISSWFAGKELAFALGINLSFSRLGSVANDIISPSSWERGAMAFGDASGEGAEAAGAGLLVAFSIGLLICVASLVAAIFLACLDSPQDAKEDSTTTEVKVGGATYLDRRTGSKQEGGGHGGSGGGGSSKAVVGSLLATPTIGRLSASDRKTPTSARRSGATGAFKGRKPTTSFGRATPTMSSAGGSTSTSSVGGDGDEDAAECSCNGFSAGYWLLALHCMTVYGGIFPFNNISAALLRAQYMEDGCPAAAEATAVGYTQGIPYSFAAAATPFIGVLVDKYGRRTAWMCGASGLLLLAHLLMAFHAQLQAMAPPTASASSAANACFDHGLSGPILPFLLVGVVYSVVAGVVWPSVMCVVDPNRKGAAFGLLNSLQNITIAIVPLGVAAQLDLYGSENYRPAELLFASLALVAAILAGLLWWWDGAAGEHALWDPTRAMPVRLATPVFPGRSRGAQRRDQQVVVGSSDEHARLLENGNLGGRRSYRTTVEYPQKAKSITILS